MGVTLRNPDAEERKKLRHLGDGFPIATLFIAEGETLEVAAGTEERGPLLGPGGERTRLNHEVRLRLVAVRLPRRQYVFFRLIIQLLLRTAMRTSKNSVQA
jgi:hypothetical protein